MFKSMSGIKRHWLILYALFGSLAAIYIWQTLFPGPIDAAAVQYFSEEEILAGRNYALGARLIYIAGIFLNVGILSWLFFARRAKLWAKKTEQIFSGNIFRQLLFLGGVFLLIKLVILPANYLGRYYWPKHWGLISQDPGQWLIDHTMSSLGEGILFVLGSMIMLLIIRRWKRRWWMIGAGLFSAWIFLSILIWPVVVDPLFNEFKTTDDPRVISMVQGLAERAGLEVDRVLVMDASRRTTRVNAYFTGLGTTQRIVLYDNLLENFPMEEVEYVVAHEIAHWQKGHMIRGAIIGSVAGFLFLLYLYHLDRLQTRGIKQSKICRDFNLVITCLLLIQLVSFIGNPLENKLSRTMEQEADSAAMYWTKNPTAAVSMQVGLAKGNKADVSPPSFISWFGYTHPPVLERIKNIEQSIEAE